MADHILKSHNRTLLMYHIVCTVKYRKSLLSESISNFIKEICLEIEERYEIFFLQIGADQDHIHFLVQSVPTISVSKIVQTIKGNIARQLFINFPELKTKLWGGAFWTDGYYANTVSQYGGEKTIMRYIENQGKNKVESQSKQKTDYKELYRNNSLNFTTSALQNKSNLRVGFFISDLMYFW
jgi:putative transposase